MCGEQSALHSGEKMGEGAEVLSVNIVNCLRVDRKIY